MYNPELSLAIRHFETQDGSRLDDRMGLTLVNAVKDAIDERDALRAENERLREFADDVRKWSEAYPTNIFPEPTPEQVDEVCKTLGFRLDRIAAMVLREFTKPWGDRARAALKGEA